MLSVSLSAGFTVSGTALHTLWVFDKYLLKEGEKKDKKERKEGPMPPSEGSFAPVMFHTGC